MTTATTTMAMMMVMMMNVLFLLPSLSKGSSSSSSSSFTVNTDNSILHSTPVSEQQPSCFDSMIYDDSGTTNIVEFICTKDAVKEYKDITHFTDHNMEIGLGVPQRIDGNENEKNAIREVLKLQDEYMKNEVLSMPEYTQARPHCKNANELCAFWSAVGECETNRVFMLGNCPAACRFCLLLHSNLA